MNEEVKAQEAAQVTVQYPAWQEAIRQAQAEQEARDAERNAKWAADARERKLKAFEETRQKLAECGLDLPESTTGKWTMDAYTFWKESNDQGLYIGISKDVPGANAQLLEDDDSNLWRMGYRAKCVELVYWRNLSGAEIANVIDELDEAVIRQADTNRRVLERKAQPEIAVAANPTPSIEERLATLLREIVREEIAAAMGWNEA